MSEGSSSKRPGLITFSSNKTLYRPAAVTGTATATGNAVSRQTWMIE